MFLLALAVTFTAEALEKFGAIYFVAAPTLASGMLYSYFVGFGLPYVRMFFYKFASIIAAPIFALISVAIAIPLLVWYLSNVVSPGEFATAISVIFLSIFFLTVIIPLSQALGINYRSYKRFAGALIGALMGFAVCLFAVCLFLSFFNPSEFWSLFSNAREMYFLCLAVVAFSSVVGYRYFGQVQPTSEPLHRALTGGVLCFYYTAFLLAVILYELTQKNQSSQLLASDTAFRIVVLAALVISTLIASIGYRFQITDPSRLRLITTGELTVPASSTSQDASSPTLEGAASETVSPAKAAIEWVDCTP